jgi:hypothetical protein
MENTTGSRPVSLRWKLVFFVPLAVAVALQLLSQRQTDLHARIKLSIIGNTLTSVSLIAYSVYLVRQSKEWWRIAMLIFASAVLGFGLYVLLRAL